MITNKVSVIMSVYNETTDELSQSINSILNQSYNNIQVIIVNDNPENQVIDDFLKKITDKRVLIIKNEKNKGLVASLNLALRYAEGEYIARMDADDISDLKRIEKQLQYIREGKYDIIGSFAQIISQKGFEGKIIKLPINSWYISKTIRMGNLLVHPSWFAKKSVYEELNGYRDIKLCEDYDFLLRAVNKGYKISNLSYPGIKYRIRDVGISQSALGKQMVLAHYMGQNYKIIEELSEDKILSYVSSQKYIADVTIYNNFVKALQSDKVICKAKVLFNKFFYIKLKKRLICLMYCVRCSKNEYK